MAAIHEVTSGFLAVCLLLVSLIRVDECLLLVRVRFPEKTAGLVVADADAAQQIPHAPRRLGGGGVFLDPVTDLLSGEEAAGGDLFLESFDLGGPKFAGIAAEVESAEGIQAVQAEASEPFADLACGDAKKVGNFVLAAAVVGPEECGE